ncbi:MAG TPA: membrane protein insertion efficiency factor YidD [Burkholderiaceae bacterium]|nr:membrane protein insertion efficiency factor YidD [Burkholderiaceae bacterium]
MRASWNTVTSAPLKWLIRGYRFFLSPWIGRQCRFEPTCSLYALEALERHGTVGGTYLAARRILRCHPWCAGGVDLVPESLSGKPAVKARDLASRE